MKHTTLLLICVFAMTGAVAQSATDALKNDNQTLRERYLLMKTKSSNYQEYKVIKENTLDGWFRIVTDTIQAKQALVRAANLKVADLEKQLAANNDQLVAKEASMKGILHESSHISVIGIDFDKGVFKGIVGALVVILALAMAVILYSFKSLQRNLKEKAELATTIGSEYEEYKRKAMDKQTKLSRELQNERNKLMELGAL